MQTPKASEILTIEGSKIEGFFIISSNFESHISFKTKKQAQVWLDEQNRVGEYKARIAELEEKELDLANPYKANNQRDLLISFGFRVINGNYKNLCNDVRTVVDEFLENRK